MPGKDFFPQQLPTSQLLEAFEFAILFMSQLTMEASNHEPSHASVTQWIEDLKNGDPQASQKIWDRYLHSLIRLANKRLGQSRRRVSDEEDVVAAAFADFFAQVEKGGFSRLHDREDLWQILVMLTIRRAIDQVRRDWQTATRPHMFGESAIGHVASTRDVGGLDLLADDGQPTPEMAMLMIEALDEKLRLLRDETLITVAVGKMKGLTNQQIADQNGIGLRSVERKLALIRKIWQRGSGDE